MNILQNFFSELKKISNPITGNTHHPTGSLTKLAQGSGRDGRLTLAELNSIAPEQLLELAGCGDEIIRLRIARNPSTPPEILTKLAADKNVMVRYNIAENKSTPESELHKLLWDKEVKVREVIISRYPTILEPQQFIELSQKYGTSEGFYAALKHKNISAKQIHVIAETQKTNKTGSILWTISEHQKVLPATLSFLAHLNIEPFEKEIIAANPNAPADLLKQMVSGELGKVMDELKEAVARNPSTPAEVLTKLGEAESYIVRTGVASNLSTSPETLTRLAEDKHLGVCYYAKQNPIYLQYRAEQDGICEAGQQLPIEWLKEMYLTNE